MCLSPLKRAGQVDADPKNTLKESLPPADKKKCIEPLGKAKFSNTCAYSQAGKHTLAPIKGQAKGYQNVGAHCTLQKLPPTKVKRIKIEA